MGIDTPIHVSEHARWRAAERFPWFDTVQIEGEVQEAIKAGRVHSERAQLGLRPTPDPASLYVWTASGDRIYALRHDATQFYVMTTMRRPA